MRKKSSSLLVGALALVLVGAGCSSTSTTPKTDTSVNTGTQANTTEDVGTQPTTDYSVGQSTGAQTKDVPNTEAGNTHRNTLVDNEIGVQVTCPPDKTWKCTLDGSGKFYIYDFSSNAFALRVVPGVSSIDAALAHEQKYLEATYPGVVKDSSQNGEAIFTVGPDPSWATQVNRKAWVQIKEVNGKFIACHGIGSESNFENDGPDYKSMCDSVKAAE
ncbi:MAG TPA: hypothetical protein PK295_00325 [Candidatus Magasanikbacteria bacterium]|nr:hypothetical protein [Candidatus Magasanikbacteria bacterium]